MKIAKTRKFIDSKNVFVITLLIIALTILSVWFYGIGTHKTVIENSLLSTSILSLAFFLFITIGLYKGIKLKDTIGKITDQLSTKKASFLKDIDASGFNGSDFDIDTDDGIGGIILSIFLWIIATLIISYLFFILGTIIWFSIVLFIAMLYWIFFRALRLIFKKSAVCNGNFERSVFYGFTYTFLYNFWIYGIILLTQLY